MDQQLLDMMANAYVSVTYGAADKLLEAGKFKAAKNMYLDEARKIVGQDFRLPAPAGEGDGGVISSALAWLEEVNAVYRCTYVYSPDPLYDWMDFHLTTPQDYRALRARALVLASQIFSSLGNTGTAATRRHTALTTLYPLTPQLKEIVDIPCLLDLYQTRHPSPQVTLSNDTVPTALQVRGSWRKINVAKSDVLTGGREDFASFIWNGRFYVAGGRKTSLGPWYRDLWALDLEKPAEWRRLPDYPVAFRQSGMFAGWRMVVHNNTTVLFTGRSTIDVFNLVTEKWTSFETTYVPTAADIAAGVQNSWPYPKERLSDAAMQIANDKLYVFGGSHGTTSMGCNLFMELDLRTRKWRRLSGYVRAPRHADYSCPGPRKSAASWVNKDKTRVYLLFGHADREGASFHDEPHGAESAFGHEDMWSWSIPDERWRRERMSGNPPCARTELACAYNEKLGKVFVFGGYQPTLPTYVMEERIQFNYSYFADTFAYDMSPSSPPSGSVSREPTYSAPKWKQVLTHGFPTYRCQAQLACDPATGRTYMFGGFTNNQYIPTRTKKLFCRSFGDIWELRTEEPGGHFDEVNLEDEARSSKAGPWQRCFSCAAPGPWKKCGGSCRGRVFFCGGPCLKDGWKEHKEMHKCRKA
ncbi:hypothetical protein GGX14DRAFT_551752 [Mycena pura]|uniref:Uncharacterized protein n=1 Tax=Mycena pura TaxID=153505 RepID=A0AAD6Y6J0_9AGAR|nr:hypothetical protein GGX14DRAFT_551752 [Mycena pura]